MIAEFRGLRATVLLLYRDQGEEVDLPGIERFNEAIDEALPRRLSDLRSAWRPTETSSWGC